MRERGVWNQHLQASSITELECWVRYRLICTPGDEQILRAEGLIDDQGELTPKGHAELARIEGGT